jgi:hypothetical protein
MLRTEDTQDAVAHLALRQMYVMRHKFDQYINGMLNYLFTSVCPPDDSGFVHKHYGQRGLVSNIA